MYLLRSGDAIIGGLSIITLLDDAARTRQELEAYEKHRKQVLKKVSRQGSGATFDDIVAVAPETKAIKAYAERLAAGDMTVLLQSESGTGKELYAQSIHNASARSGEVFLAVNCANFNAEMLDSELFGYVEGTFTGAKKAEKSVFLKRRRAAHCSWMKFRKWTLACRQSCCAGHFSGLPLQQTKVRQSFDLLEITYCFSLSRETSRFLEFSSKNLEVFFFLCFFAVPSPSFSCTPSFISKNLESKKCNGGSSCGKKHCSAELSSLPTFFGTVFAYRGKQT